MAQSLVRKFVRQVQVLSVGGQISSNPSQPSKSITVINFTQVWTGSFEKGFDK